MEAQCIFIILTIMCLHTIGLSAQVPECYGSRLGMANGDIQDSQLSSSKNPGGYHTALDGRLEDNTGAWCAGSYDANPWIQVDLLKPVKVTGVITQGHHNFPYWVTSYRVLHSLDGTDFTYVEDSEGSTKTFTGNVDRSTKMENVFYSHVTAQYIRINPTDWYSNRICMRFEVLGCTSVTVTKVKPGTTTSAPTDLDRELGELAGVSVTKDNVLIVAKNLTYLTDDNVQIDDDNLEDISNILHNIVAVNDPSLKVTESVVNIVDNIIKSYVAEKGFDNEVTSVPEAPNQIQRTLEQQITTLHTNPDIVNETIKARNLAIQAVQVPKESVVSRRLVFEAIPEGQNEILNINVTTGEAGELSEDKVEAAISFQLPIEIFSDIDGDQSLAVSFFVYNYATLFPSTLLVNNSSGDDDQDNVQRIVASHVISAKFESIDIEVKNLPEGNPVDIVFALNKVNEYEGKIDEINAIECVFWDITASNGLGDWSYDGCQYNRTLADGRVVCHCNHLTSFAVLVDIHGKKSRVLDAVSKLGCGISITCLLITLITFISARSMRKKKPMQILISFCFSLLFLYVVFVIGIERGTKSDVECVMVSALLHYFTLTSVAWMAVEAFHMYCLFVKVVGRWAHISRFLLKASFLAWGLPAVVVIIVLIADVNQYNNENYCFLQIGYAFYFTHLMVLGLVLGINTILFGLVIHRVTCGRNTTSLARNKQEERQQILKGVQNAIAISLLMGLTWVFGLFALIHEDSSLVFQFFFCIFNSCQGAFIFVMYCVRQPDVVAIWKDWISCCKTNGNICIGKKDHQSSGVVSDMGQKTLSSDVATSKL